MPAAIPAQTVSPPLGPHAAGTVGSLGLKPGQVVEARVLGPGADGTTRIAVHNQVLDAALPGRLPPGTTLQLQLQGGGANAQLVVLQAAAPAQLPAPTTTLQALALKPAQVIEAKVLGHTPNGATRLALGSRVVDVALPQAHPPGTALQLRAQGSGANQRLVVTHATPPPAPHAQPTATLEALALRPGQAVQAQVLGAGQSGATAQGLQSVAGGVRPLVAQGLPSAAAATPGQQPAQGGTVRLAIGTQVIDTVLPGRYQPGTTLQVRAEGTGANTRLVVLQSVSPGAGANSTASPTRAEQPLPPLAVVATPPAPASQAIVQAAQAAAGKQDSIATLFASLAGLEGKLGPLPASVQQPALAALAARLNLNNQPLNGQTLKQAVLRSGVFFESSAAKGAAPGPGNGSGILQGDLKAILLTLKGSLQNWLGSDTSPATSGRERPAPPTRGALPHAQRPGMAILPNAASPTQTGKALLTQTEAALARLRLAQIASLPENSGLQRAGGQGALAEWNLEIPLLLGHELSIAQFQISRDRAARSRRETRGWQVRFSVDFSAMGPVDAQVTLRAGIVGVNLWAEREETAEMLREQLDVLGEALEAIGLKPGRLYCRHGAPAEPHRPVGAFMDRCS